MGLDSIVERHPDAAAERVGGRWVVATADDRLHSFDRADGTVSEEGERIFGLVDGRRTVGEIVTELIQEFEVSAVECERQTVSFVAGLIDRHILVLKK